MSKADASFIKAMLCMIVCTQVKESELIALFGGMAIGFMILSLAYLLGHK